MVLAGTGIISCGGGGTTPSAPTVTKPAVQLSSTSLNFAGQVVGSTSPAQTVTLTNTGNGALTIASIVPGGPSGNFAVSTTCGAAVAASASCSIKVTFTPTTGGTASGFITITDDAATSPQSVSLNGTGMAGLMKLSTDTFTNLTSQHATEVEPDTFAHGSTIVSVFQVGRFFNGGSSAIGFSTSSDGGATWTPGFLPGITTLESVPGTYDRVSDPSVAYDAAHAVWLVASLPLLAVGTTVTAPGVLVSRSTDGIHWDTPVAVVTGGDLDKSWIACDDWPMSPYFGNCYVEWDDPAQANLIQMSTSTDGGLTWGAPLATADGAGGIGGEPVVRPDGRVVVPIANAYETGILSFYSDDGGASWSSTVRVAPTPNHLVAGHLRYGPLPSADADSSGKIYVVWPDCSFRTDCTSNDIVMSTSTDGVTWTSPARIPLDDLSSGADHFIPGIAVDPATAGSTAHLSLVYYYYPSAACATSTCELDLGYVSSTDGGATWSAPVQLAGPVNVTSLPATSIGYMVADYISLSFANGLAYGAFAVANPNAGATFDEAIYTTANGLSARATTRMRSSAGETRVRNARSDHAARRTPAIVR